MANRRMLSKTITDSSGFLQMPLSSQALYMHLNQHADDDGYCEFFGIMRMCGANADDLKVLQAREFVLVFDDRVLILKDWKENNYIQKDRYQPSKYLDVYTMDTKRVQDVSKAYTETNQGSESHVYKMDTEVRLELGKDSIETKTQAEVAKAPAANREGFRESLAEETRTAWDAWESCFSEITTALEDNRAALNRLLALEGSPEKVVRLIQLAAKAWSEPYTPKEVKASSPKTLWEKRSALLAWGKGKFQQSNRELEEVR